MNILFISRSTLYSTKGGDSVQMENTAKYLHQLGVVVDIEYSNNKFINYHQYDLIHFFNITRPADILYHISKSGLPYVVSPIYLEYTESDRFQQERKLNILNLILKTFQTEYFKVIGRWLLNGEKIVSLQYLLLGQKKSIKKILKGCKVLLPNSKSEYARLKRDFPDAGAFTVITNGVDTTLFKQMDEQNTSNREGILCVARFERRKNQLAVIEALSNTNLPITFVGDVAPNHKAYFKACKNAATEYMHFLPCLDQSELVALYNKHKVHILASWFETTGLSSLEASVCGCNLVISKNGDTEEYFSDQATYCNPADVISILSAVNNALENLPNQTLRQKISQNYNWEKTAAQTLLTYKEILGL